MERKEILKNFLQKVVLPVVLAVFLFFLFRPVCTEENGTINYVLLWILCGIPFGIRRMFLWLVPRNYDIAGTVGIWAVNFIVGGLIGGVLLIWRLACAVFYLFKFMPKNIDFIAFFNVFLCQRTIYLDFESAESGKASGRQICSAASSFPEWESYEKEKSIWKQ